MNSKTAKLLRKQLKDMNELNNDVKKIIYKQMKKKMKDLKR